MEASGGYGRFLHGEGVAIGMMGAARIAQRMGMVPADVVERQHSLLRRFNLPIRAEEVTVSEVLQAMSLDKKTVGGANRFVLLETGGPSGSPQRRSPATWWRTQ